MLPPESKMNLAALTFPIVSNVSSCLSNLNFISKIFDISLTASFFFPYIFHICFQNTFRARIKEKDY